MAKKKEKKEKKAGKRMSKKGKSALKQYFYKERFVRWE